MVGELKRVCWVTIVNANGCIAVERRVVLFYTDNQIE
jgi:hypothetical protein